MKEVVLPVSGDFARYTPIKFSQLRQAMAAPDIIVALIEMTMSIDGRPVDPTYLDDMALADAMVIFRMVSQELAPIGFATGVA